MMAMEAWLAELEMEANSGPSLINNTCHQYHQCETMEATFTEQLTATLGENFLNPYTAESNTSSPDLWDIDNIIIDQFTPPQISNTRENNNNSNSNSNSNNKNKNDDNESQHFKEENSNKQAAKGGAKRKRQPSQVQDHILAERRRRELLSQMFISLSALLPGLKKMDKTSVLGEAIKHMKQLQEKVKTLEEVVAKKTVESVVVIKKSQLVVNDDKADDNVSCSTVDDNSTSVSSGGNGGDDGGGGGGGDIDNNAIDSLPEIEVRISGDTLLLKVYCQNKKGVLTKLFQELEKHELSVTNTSVLPFDSLALDITIVAQIQREVDLNAKNFVRNLRTAFR